MSEMIDRAMRASFYAWRQRMKNRGISPWNTEADPEFEDMHPSEQEFARLHAIAVITALREPTDAMVKAGCDAGGSWESENEDFRLSWRAQIDEALK